MFFDAIHVVNSAYQQCYADIKAAEKACEQALHLAISSDGQMASQY